MEYIYITYRRGLALFNSVIFSLCRIACPIHSNKVVFCSTEGKGGYGDNPKAIAEALHEAHPELELVWLLNDIDKKFPAYVRKCKNSLLKRAYEYSTAKIWIDCHRKPYGTNKRAGQFYIQTWHGPIGFKPVAADRGPKLPRIAGIVSRADSELIDVWLTNSNWNEELVKRALYYHGRTEKIGSPRCDVLFDRDYNHRTTIREHYNIPPEASILIYAPTFRAGSQNTQRRCDANEFHIDFSKILSCLAEAFGGEWYMMLRLHPQVAEHISRFPLNGCKSQNIIDVSQAGDVYEILAASDVLLTDYSSLAFDYGYVEKPVFLYAEDIDEISADRNGLYFDPRRLPYPFAETEEQLLDNIKSFDELKYKERLQKFHREVGLMEDGKASRRAVKIIEELLAGS